MECPRLRGDEAAQRLNDGAVLLLGTDTVLGLHCRADHPDAVNRIAMLKNTTTGQPFLLLAGSMAQVQAMTASLTQEQLAACDRCWPGPFSLILPAGSGVPVRLSGADRTVALRIPAVRDLRTLVSRSGGVLVSTSANLTGQDTSGDIEAACGIFAGGIDGYWLPEPPQGVISQGGRSAASALVDLTVSPPVVRRQGPLPFPKA